MPEVVEGSLVAKGRRFAIVASRFNDAVTSRLIGGAMDCFVRHGVAEKDIRLVRVPGSFEIPVAARRLAAGGAMGRSSASALSCAGNAALRCPRRRSRGAARARWPWRPASRSSSVSYDGDDRAGDRSRGGKGGNKGWDSALAAIEMANLFASLGPSRG